MMTIDRAEDPNKFAQGDLVSEGAETVGGAGDAGAGSIAAGGAGANATETTERAWRFPGAWTRFLLPAAIGLSLDLWLKAWSFPDGVPPVVLGENGKPSELPAGRWPGIIIDPDTLQWTLRDPTPVIPHVLGFQTTVNHGMVFGIGQGKVMIFLALSLVALGVILWVFLTSLRRQWMVHLALGMITAGAIGNVYDRAVHHGVRDMLRFVCFRFPPLHLFGFQFPSGVLSPDGTLDWYPYIFNLADVLLCVGVPVLIVRWMLMKDTPQKLRA